MKQKKTNKLYYTVSRRKLAHNKQAIKSCELAVRIRNWLLHINFLVVIFFGHISLNVTVKLATKTCNLFRTLLQNKLSNWMLHILPPMHASNLTCNKQDVAGCEKLLQKVVGV